MSGEFGPLEIAAGTVMLLGWIVPLIYWLAAKRTGRGSKELIWIAALWGLAALLTVIHRPLGFLLLLGWPVVLIVGLARLDTPKVGRLLLAMGSLWGVVVLILGVPLVTRLTPGEESSYGARPFVPSAYTGSKGSLTVDLKDLKSISTVYSPNGVSHIYYPEDGKIVMPAGKHHLMEIKLSSKTKDGAVWTASGRPKTSIALEIAEGKTASLPAVGAITAAVKVDYRSGRDVGLSFGVTDASGGKWQINGPPGTDPRFIGLDKTGKKVWQGKFAYG